MLRLAMPSGREKRTIQKLLRPVKTQKKTPAQMDTTDYLMRDPLNRELLLKAIDDVKHRRNLVFHDLIEP